MDAANALTPGQNAPSSELSERDQQILAFERLWWKYAGAKEQAIREKFAMSATRYYQVLNALIDRPEALAFDPLLTKRLRRLRSARQKQRSARRLGIEGVGVTVVLGEEDAMVTSRSVGAWPRVAT